MPFRQLKKFMFRKKCIFIAARITNSTDSFRPYLIKLFYEKKKRKNATLMILTLMALLSHF